MFIDCPCIVVLDFPRDSTDIFRLAWIVRVLGCSPALFTGEETKA